MPRREIRIGGLGGQGVIMAGMILGRAAAIFEGRHAAMIQSFGPEARGSACSCQLTIDDEVIQYPYIENPDVLVTLSQEALDLFLPSLKPQGILVFDSELVTPRNLPEGIKCYSITAARFAEQMRRRMVLNIIILGFLTAVTDVTSGEAMRQAVKASVPVGTDAFNLAAFDLGYGHGLDAAGGAAQETEAVS
jgi:2-oxoglutarate ferredoxin oxidoreductase subunit gamma